MTETNDGFEIAEADLKLRGPGDLEGTQQSGVSFTLRLANLARDGQVLQLARETAEKVLDDDPHCAASKNDILWRQLNKLRDRTVNWGVISRKNGLLRKNTVNFLGLLLWKDYLCRC